MNRAFPARRRACKRSSLRALVLVASLATAFGPAHAVGLGRPVTASSLGQSLNLIVPLRLDADEMLAPECVAAEVMVGESRLPAPLVRVVLESGGDGLPRALRVVSLSPVEEPVVVVNLAVGCPARLTRQFVAFIDPPATQAQVPPPQLAQLLQPAPPATPVAPPEAPRRASVASAPTLAQAAVEPAPKPRSATPKPRNATPKPRVVRLTADGEGQPAAAAVVPPPPSKPAARAVAAAKASSPVASTGRLKLDAPEPALASPVAPSAAASAVDVAALLARAASDVAGAESAEAQRLRQLESSLAQLRAEAKQTNETLAALRLQLQRAQQERSPNSLIYGLGLLALLLGGACLYLWRLRERELHQREMAWWNSPEAASQAPKPEGQAADLAATAEVTRMAEVAKVASPVAAPVAPPAVAVPAAPPAPAPVATVAAADTAASGAVADMPVEVLEALRVSREPVPPLHEQTLAFARVSAAPDFSASKYLPELSMMELGTPAAGMDHSEPELRSDFARSAFGAHEVSAEELIDLEQQAEFFVVLGQDEAAIELLQGHVQGHQGGSALPYLKLLEIHRRRGDITAYAEISEILTQRFGVLPPDWDVDPEAAHGLEAYPQVLVRLQQQWSDHGASMDLLQRLLVRPQGREAGAGAGPASSMDIAAYLDMLLLYSVARDLSEREVRGDEVDVFLPLDQPGDSPQSTAMMATLPVQVDGPRSRLGELDLDISIGGDSVNSKL